jgi:hypothetical protein
MIIVRALTPFRAAPVVSAPSSMRRLFKQRDRTPLPRAPGALTHTTPSVSKRATTPLTRAAVGKPGGRVTALRRRSNSWAARR